MQEYFYTWREWNSEFSHFAASPPSAVCEILRLISTWETVKKSWVKNHHRTWIARIYDVLGNLLKGFTSRLWSTLLMLHGQINLNDIGTSYHVFTFRLFSLVYHKLLLWCRDFSHECEEFYRHILLFMCRKKKCVCCDKVAWEFKVKCQPEPGSLSHLSPDLSKREKKKQHLHDWMLHNRPDIDLKMSIFKATNNRRSLIKWWCFLLPHVADWACKIIESQLLISNFTSALDSHEPLSTTTQSRDFTFGVHRTSQVFNCSRRWHEKRFFFALSHSRAHHSIDNLSNITSCLKIRWNSFFHVDNFRWEWDREKLHNWS